MRNRAILVLMGLVVGCSSGDDGDDTTPTPTPDAGPVADAGVAASDAGTPDAGNTTDAGTPDAGATPDAGTTTASIRFANVTPSSAFDVYVDDETQPLVAVAAGEGLDFVDIPSGTRDIHITPAGAPPAQAVVTSNVDFAADGRFGLVVSEDANATVAANVVDAQSTVANPDVEWQLTNLAPSGGPLTVSLVGTGTVVTDLAAGDAERVTTVGGAAEIRISTTSDDSRFFLPDFGEGVFIDLYVIEAPALQLMAQLPDGSIVVVPSNEPCNPLSHPGSITLTSTMASTGRIAEYNLTQALAEIGNGDGTVGDGDGLYNTANPAQQYGSDVDIFPREGAFQVGSVAFDASSATGCGVETFALTHIDTSAFWTSGQSGDLSDDALGLWFFTAPLSFTTGPLDAADTVTFTDGVLTSIDLDVELGLTIDYSFAGNATTWTGRFTISGNTISMQMDDTQMNVPTVMGPQPQSRVEIDLNGTVTAVSN